MRQLKADIYKVRLMKQVFEKQGYIHFQKLADELVKQKPFKKRWSKQLGLTLQLAWARYRKNKHKYD